MAEESRTPEVFVFDKRPDMFEVTGLDQKKDKKGQVAEGYVYRWVNDSDGCAMNFEQKRREYWDICKDPDIKAQFAESRQDGEAVVIKANNERYVLMKRPLAASQAQFEAENSAKNASLRSVHKASAPQAEGIKTEWQFTSKYGKGEIEESPKGKRGR
jgi:hypothetical protein